MAQIKVYGLASSIGQHRSALSEAIHRAVVEVLGLPAEKRFQRFMPLSREDFIHPPDRSAHYLIIEVSLFEGRTTETKKAFIRALFSHIHEACGIAPHDVEITLFETPRSHWGIRGMTGDELGLGYKVEV